jgi:hypothetical protein
MKSAKAKSARSRRSSKNADSVPPPATPAPVPPPPGEKSVADSSSTYGYAIHFADCRHPVYGDGTLWFDDALGEVRVAPLEVKVDVDKNVTMRGRLVGADEKGPFPCVLRQTFRVTKS